VSKTKTTEEKLKEEIARLKNIIKDKNHEIHTLAEISRVIVSGRYLNEVLSLVATMTAEMTGSKICSIMIYDDKTQELKIIATQSLSKAYRDKPPVKVGQSVSGKAVLSKKPIAITDVVKDPDYMYKEIAKKEGLKSMLAVPMIIGDKAIGVINIYTAQKHRFTDDEIRVILAISGQAAIGIENMHLREEALIAWDALETRKIVDRAKGLLMKRLGINEDDAYKSIHKKSMDTRKSMREVAEAIMLTMDIKN